MKDNGKSKPGGGRLRRIWALVRKETLQVVRDPSSLVVAFILPAILLTLFGFGVSFDATRMRVRLVVEDPTSETSLFVASLANTSYFQVERSADRRAFLERLSAGRLDGIVVLAGDFSQRLARGDTAGIQVITDGSDPNTAGLVTGYLRGAWQSWLTQRALSAGEKVPALINVEPRFWFNAELESRRFLVPGSIALIQMMIGSLLTALVVAREWERGTIEALLATPVSQIHAGELPQLQDVVRGVLRDGHGSTVTLTCRRSSGTCVPAEMTLWAFRDEDGRVVVVALVRDRSEHRAHGR